MKRPPPPDPYVALGVAREASPAAIRAAYRRLAMECHPDRNPGDDGAAERFRAAAAAYEILGDEAKRKHYDETGEAMPRDSREDQAIGTLASLFCGLVRELGDRALSVNIVAMAKEQVNAELRKLAQDQAKLRKEAETYRKIMAKLARKGAEKGAEDPLGGALAADAANREAKAKDLDDEQELGRRMLALLEQYEYFPEAAAVALGAWMHPGAFFAGGASSSTTGL